MVFYWPTATLHNVHQGLALRYRISFSSGHSPNTGRPYRWTFISRPPGHIKSQEPASVSGVLTSLLQTVAVKAVKPKFVCRSAERVVEVFGGWKSPGPDPSLVPGRFREVPRAAGGKSTPGEARPGADRDRKGKRGAREGEDGGRGRDRGRRLSNLARPEVGGGINRAPGGSLRPGRPGR